MSTTCDSNESSKNTVDDHEDVGLAIGHVEAVEDGEEAAGEGRDQSVASRPRGQDPFAPGNALNNEKIIKKLFTCTTLSYDISKHFFLYLIAQSATYRG
jgi:hypothetical protein